MEKEKPRFLQQLLTAAGITAFVFFSAWAGAHTDHGPFDPFAYGPMRTFAGMLLAALWLSTLGLVVALSDRRSR